VRVPAPGYLRGVRELCDKNGALLAFDEVQTGLGRTGTLFGYQHEGVMPDIMTLAKGLGNGVPIGAMGCTERVSAGFAPGSHAATFGGNPLSSAAAVATMEVLTEPGFVETAAAMGEHLFAALRTLAAKHPKVIEVRGRGLMAGIECAEPVAPAISALLDAGIICGPAGPNVIRFLPPLIVSEDDIDRAAGTLDRVLGELGW
jgi:acetylornithine/succinyldiaminopimelate/putrescine aminotransferase